MRYRPVGTQHARLRRPVGHLHEVRRLVILGRRRRGIVGHGYCAGRSSSTLKPPACGGGCVVVVGGKTRIVAGAPSVVGVPCAACRAASLSAWRSAYIWRKYESTRLTHRGVISPTGICRNASWRYICAFKSK